MAENKLAIEAREYVAIDPERVARIIHTIERLRSEVQTAGLAFPYDTAFGDAIERATNELSDIEDALFEARIEAARA